ncbi:pre-rRNA-processing protein TSR2 isoform X1 [Thalictrum thalictroides]|uniref:Pre-rRNA-processing protein TSR2 isoform X1 n=1 Tax=Thalictrum thalictroides TaxID=46969 RepID=A0A7J6VBH6_THATH|nr:pre-rRNA-processing protein TSR2 isoform X1 [Thalictrum thalictroides]
MHEELLLNDLKSIEKLRTSSSASEALSKSKEVVTNMNEGDDGSSTDDASDMAVDEPKSMLDSKSEIMPIEEMQKETVEAEEGWSVVSSRRNKSKRR